LTFEFFVDLIIAVFVIFFTILLIAFFSRLILELEFLLKIAPVILVSLALVFLLARSEGLLYSSLLGVFIALGVYFVTMTKRSHTGPENMIGMSGIATKDFDREDSTAEYYRGRVKIGGVIWRAQSRVKLRKGDSIIVLEVWERLTLHVDRKDRVS
jgi:membrane protein implicated in regulation of membrane protease activity